MNALRVASTSVVVVLTALTAPWPSGESRAYAQASDSASSIVGAWTLNKDLSDHPPDREAGREGGQGGQGGRHGGGYGRGGGGGGGYGHGGFGRGGGGNGGGSTMSPEDMARMRDAMRDVMNPPDRLTITQAERMVIMTTGDGRTTRLSADGKTVKDESTKIERKTRWDGGELGSEISHLGPGKITETDAADPEHHQMHVAIQLEGSRQPMTMNRVYDGDAR